MHDEETAFYIADTTLLDVALELSSPFAPLLTVKDRGAAGHPARTGLTGTIELTDLGRAVLAGREDRITAVGSIGGWAACTCPEPAHWRWDRAHERVVRV